MGTARHLVTLDLPGFGHSQRRDALLSPREMGELIIRITDTFRLQTPHGIGPDVGTAASLFAVALYPGRLRSLVVGSGGTAVPLQLGGVRKDWVEAPDQDYLSSYEGDRFVTSMRYVRTYPTDLPVLRDLPTASFSTSGCPTASSTSSTRGTSRGSTQPTSTQHSSRAGGAEGYTTTRSATAR
jgi:pimeloyl-ACP methyl ester carboxylesterase